MNSLELRENAGMNMFNKSELESQIKILDYLIKEKRCEKIADNTFEIELETGSFDFENKFTSNYTFFRFTVQFEKHVGGQLPYEFDWENNNFIICKGIREFKNFFSGIKSEFGSRENKKDFARMKEIGFENFVKEKAPQWFKDTKWSNLFIELVNKSDEEIKTEAEKKYSDKIISYTGTPELVREAIAKPSRKDELYESDYYAWSKLVDKYEQQENKFYRLRQVVRSQWELYQENLRQGRLNQALEQLKSEKSKEYQTLAEEVLNNKILLEDIAKKAETDIKKLFPELDVENKDNHVANNFIGYFMNLARQKQKEAIANEKKSWTSEQWKNFWPNKPTIRLFDKELLEKTKHSKDFVGECKHCQEAGETTFKLVLKTKHSAFFICSRCENTEYHVNFERNSK